MKKTILFVTAMCVGLVAMTASAAEKAENPNLAVSEKVSAIDAYVRNVEKNISSSQRKEQMLTPGELKNVTNENWTKIHTYSDGADLKRMKLYPTAGSQKTEEFYYRDGKPVFVFLEANGAGKENHDQNATGDKYYFADGKLIAATAADGKSIDVKSAEAEKMSEKLQKESEAFRATVK
jgi:hypothetical protein